MANKLNAKKVTVNGITYDSRKEARRHAVLLEMEKNGEITDLQMQVKFVLIPAQYELYERYGKKGQRLKDGRRCIERECAYVADFVYTKNGEMVVEDTKGYRNPSTATYAYFVLKRKLMLFLNGIRIKEV
jgi:hypothetical protein